MLRTYKAILLICFAASLWACSSAQPKHKMHLNICVLGNSYSNDAYSYVPFILKQYGITTHIHIYYRGSGSLHDLDEQWYDDSETGHADLDNGQHVRRHYSINTKRDKKWIQNTRKSANDILTLEKWDIISLQQGGKRAKDISTYEPYLQHLIDRIDSLCDYDYKLAWFMAYTSAKDTAHIASLRTQEEVVGSYPFDLVFPVATAVFSAQRVPEFARLGDSKYHMMYAQDNVHLQEGIPCYIAALSIAQAILCEYAPELSVRGNKIRPTQAWIDGINGITQNGKSTGVTGDNCAKAQEIAIEANEAKYILFDIDN